MDLADLIIEHRTKNGLSQRKFAAKCDISTGYISLIEKKINPQTGKKMMPTLGILNKLAVGMGLTLDDLLAICDDMDVILSEKIEVKEGTCENSILDELTTLFCKLTKEQQEMIIKMMKGLAQNE